MNTYICIDIGGTNIKHGVMNSAADFLVTGETPTEAHLGGPGIMDKVRSIIDAYLQTYEAAGVCISTAGMVDCGSGEIIYAGPTIPNYKGTAIKSTIESAYHIPCEVENDVNCAALAEHYAGAARGTDSSLCLTIGTGIGGAMIINGQIHHGHSYSGCEVGYMHIMGDLFQNLGASSILVKKVSRLKGRPPGAIDGKIIFQKAKEGDADCILAIDELADVLGMGIANICYIINPEVVVLGGGIMAQKDYLYPKIRAALDRYLIPFIAEKTRLEFAQNQNQAGMLGAWLHFQAIHENI